MSARSFGRLIGGYGQRKSKANPDAPTDPVRACSYDEKDPRAKPHRPIGNGSQEHKRAFSNASLATLEALFNRQRDEGYQGKYRIQASYLKIWRDVLREFLFPTGEFIFSYQKAADVSRQKLSTVKRCFEALEVYGFVSHVRRSRLNPEKIGKPGSPFEQAPNAYYFDCRKMMPPRVYRDFVGLLRAGLKRVTEFAARAAHVILQCFNSKAMAAPRESKAELRMMLARLDHRIVDRDTQSSTEAVIRPPERSIAPS